MRGESSIATDSVERTVRELHQQEDVAHDPSNWGRLHLSGQKEKARDVEGRVKGIISRILEETMCGSKLNTSDNPCWRRWKRQDKNWAQGIWRRCGSDSSPRVGMDMSRGSGDTWVSSAGGPTLGVRGALGEAMLQVVRLGHYEGPIKKILAGLRVIEKAGRIPTVVQAGDWLMVKAMDQLRNRRPGVYVRWAPHQFSVRRWPRGQHCPGNTWRRWRWRFWQAQTFCGSTKQSPYGGKRALEGWWNSTESRIGSGGMRSLSGRGPAWG